MSPTTSLPISADTRLRPSRRLPGRQLAGETVVVDPRERRVFLMNRVAGVVWEGVERGASAGEIAADVVRRFRVGEAQAAADVERFLADLEAAGLATRDPVEG